MNEGTRIIPVPDGKDYTCLQCAVHLDRDTPAAVLIHHIGVPTGMCGNHAEVMDLEDFEEAVRLFNEEAKAS